MSGIVGGNLGRGSGLVKAGAIDDNSVTLAKMAGLARGKLIYGDASGDPAALAVGAADEVLTHDGTDFDWAAAAGGGITEQDSWRLQSGWSNPSGAFITSNWERCDTDGFALLGTGLSESSGVFSFPSTGHWLIFAGARFYNDTADDENVHMQIDTTQDNSTYNLAMQSRQSINWVSFYGYANTFGMYSFDVTDISTHKFKIYIDNDEENTVLGGGSSGNETYINAIKLADT